MEETRISKLREYLIGIINALTQNEKYQINANMLLNEPNNYSLDKIPTERVVTKWIIGTRVQKDVYSFRSRMSYSQDTLENLANMGFFEAFEDIIEANNIKGVLPNIDNIRSIECLNCGTMNSAETGTAEFDIQLQVTYLGGMYENSGSN